MHIGITHYTCFLVKQIRKSNTFASPLSSCEELLFESSLSSHAMYARLSFGFFSFFLSTLFSFSLLAFGHSILICPCFPQFDSFHLDVYLLRLPLVPFLLRYLPNLLTRRFKFSLSLDSATTSSGSSLLGASLQGYVPYLFLI